MMLFVMVVLAGTPDPPRDAGGWSPGAWPARVTAVGSAAGPTPPAPRPRDVGPPPPGLDEPAPDPNPTPPPPRPVPPKPPPSPSPGPTVVTVTLYIGGGPFHAPRAVPITTGVQYQLRGSAPVRYQAPPGYTVIASPTPFPGVPITVVP